MTAGEAPTTPRQSDGWGLLTASHVGASHGTTGQPNQDAVASRSIGPDALVVAVADGHGDKRHFRSARGAQLAVSIGCQAGAELAAGLEALVSAEQIEDEARAVLVPAIIGGWREAVRADLDARPLTESEEADKVIGDEDLIAYGSTLLLALIWRHWLILAQIGDGDVVAVTPSGSPLRPVPGDPVLTGNQTTSLCGPHPEGDFRLRAVDMRRTPLLALLVATDGYGNAQAADPWAEAVSADLAELIGERDAAWFGEQLPVWASRCASAEGSGDDATIALLIAPGAAAARQRAKLAAGAPTYRYVKSVPDRPMEPPAEALTAEPATIGDLAARRFQDAGRRRIALIAAAAAAVVVLVAVGVQLLSSSAPRGAAIVPHASPSAASPSPGHVIRAGKVEPLPKSLPPGTPIRSAGQHTVIILLGNQLWWCKSGMPRPTGCRRLVDLTRFHVAAQLQMCGTGPRTMIEVPGQGGRQSGVQVTFDPRTLEVSFAVSSTPQCPLAAKNP